MYLESMPLSMREQLMRLAGLDLDDLEESEDHYSSDLSVDLSASFDDDELPIVTPPPPRPPLRRADQVSEDSLDEDDSWLDQLPQVSALAEDVAEVEPSARVGGEAHDEGQGHDEAVDQGEGDEPISFKDFLKKKQSES